MGLPSSILIFLFLLFLLTNQCLISQSYPGDTTRVLKLREGVLADYEMIGALKAGALRLFFSFETTNNFYGGTYIRKDEGKWIHDDLVLVGDEVPLGSKHLFIAVELIQATNPGRGGQQ